MSESCPGVVVPIYSASSGDDRGKALIRSYLPPRTIIVDGESNEISMTSVRGDACRCKQKEAQDEAPEPIMTVSTTAPLSDMSALARVTRNGEILPTAIYFENFNPRDVWLLFKFYREISGDTDKSDQKVSTALRGPSLNMRDTASNALFTLSTILGAGIFLDAIQSPMDSYPEVSLTRTMMRTHAVFKKTVPYVVIPRFAPETYNPPMMPAIVLDGKTGLYVVRDSLGKNIKSKMKKRPTPEPPETETKPADNLHHMSMATYMNLTSLYKVLPNPRLVVFANIDPTAVNGMISFYERIVSPGSFDMRPDKERQIIYSSLEKLKSPAMANSARDWLILAKRSGAVPFETLLRRNLWG